MVSFATDVYTLQLFLAFARLTTPIHGKGCGSRQKVGNKMQLYLAFARSTTPIHGNGCTSCRKVATLPHARARPRQSMVRVAFPIDGAVLVGSGFRKNKYTEEVRSLNNRLRSVCTQEKSARCIDRQNPLLEKDERYE